MNSVRNLSIFCRYGENGASSRLRFFRYRPYFERAGINVEISSFFNDAYLQKLYACQKRSLLTLPAAFVERGRDILDAYEDSTFLIEYELFPMLGANLEKLLLRNRRFFLNYDDPVWEKYAKIPFLKNKYDILVKSASGVIVANDMLAERFGKLNSNILKVPTAVDLDHYVSAAGSVKKFPRFTVVWIGTPATFPYLQNFAPVLKKMAEVCDFELLMIGKSSWTLPGVPCRSVEWSEETEAELLARSHVGIMPLPDESFARGKSAYKLIQYAAARIPALGSPVGENNKVIRHGETGFLCDSAENWCDSLKKLYDSTDLRDAMGKAAGVLASDWSIEKHAARVIDFIFPE